MFGPNSGVCQLGAEEERILASFTRRLIEIAAVRRKAWIGHFPDRRETTEPKRKLKQIR